MLLSHPIHLLALVNIGLLKQYIPPTAKSYNSPDIPTSDSGQRTTYTSEYIVEHHFHNEINGGINVYSNAIMVVIRGGINLSHSFYVICCNV